MLLAAFVLVPLILPWLARRIGARVFYVAAVLPIAAFAQAIWAAPGMFAGDVPFESYDWLPSLGVSISMRMDVLAWVMTLIVTGVGALVLLYCRWYFSEGEAGIGRFSAVLLAFSGAMYGLVLTDDIIMLVMFWEITSVLSFLLIGHYSQRASSRRAALQALLVTTLGGLVMLIGVVLMVADTGTSSMTEIFAMAPTGVLIDAALVLILVGALSKSAIFPFHFWLPSAMAAPTPVSAYLHAAAMVKAGIYLLARFSPTFADALPWRPIVVCLGIFTLLMAGWQALRETDLKRILAFGTVSQLGLLTVTLGFGIRSAALAGLALLISHALFKSCLFLIVGVIDRQLSTRDIRELSGVGRQAPVMTIAAVVAVCSMVGIIPTIGFVAKEGVLAGMLGAADGGSGWGLAAFIGIALGSLLTAAYGARFLWGAFATKSHTLKTHWPDPPIGFLGAPVLLAGLSLVLGLCAPLLDRALAPYADTAPLAPAGVTPPEHIEHLALWHGFNLALVVTIGSIVLGVLLFVAMRRWGLDTKGRVLRFTAADVYNLIMHGVDRLSVIVTTFTQRGSLPVYVGTIFVVFVAAQATALFAGMGQWQFTLSPWQTPEQLLAAPVMIAAGIFAVRARKRYTGVVLVSVTGLGMIILFGTSGAPDLAVTQVLVETVTLVAFALVLRRLPSQMGDHNDSVWPVARAVLGVSVGVVMACVTMVATGARIHRPISDAFPGLAYEIGHGSNVVNVALVDLRGWDTMGELSVLILAATGVSSLVFVTGRTDFLSQLKALPNTKRRERRRLLIETSEGLAPETAQTAGSHRAWLVGGQRMLPESRSLLLEVIVRVLFHTVIVSSIYLLFAGHNLPGGGFAGGLVAGMALVMRYIAGGRFELGAAAPTDAGRLLGAGMVLAVGCAILPLFFGEAPLNSTLFEAEVPVLGHIEFVTSTIFDIGVYLVVIGLVLDVLRSLGAEVDRQSKEPATVGVGA